MHKIYFEMCVYILFFKDNIFKIDARVITMMVMMMQHYYTFVSGYG